MKRLIVLEVDSVRLFDVLPALTEVAPPITQVLSLFLTGPGSLSDVPALIASGIELRMVRDLDGVNDDLGTEDALALMSKMYAALEPIDRVMDYAAALSDDARILNHVVDGGHHGGAVPDCRTASRVGGVAARVEEVRHW